MAELSFIEGYPETMYESIEFVHKTRQTRAKEKLGPMSLEDREEVLKIHPDYAAGGKREIKIGPNKGDVAPNEVADLLEAYPLVDEKTLDLSRIDYEPDLLIIGSGLTGITAAIWAMDSGVQTDRIFLATKLRLGDSNSIMAQAGTQAADGPDDSPAIHFIDALGGGHFTNKTDVLKALVEDAPRIVRWLEDLGVMWDRTEDGSFLRLAGGGTSRKRMHSCKDYTGLEEVRVIRDEFRSRKVPYIEFYPAIELLTDEDGAVAGAILWNMETGDYKIVKAKVTILATGGLGRLHVRGFPTTNHYGATCDGVVLAYRVGAKLIDLDTVQYHPTGAAYPQQIIGLLLTEKLRGAGAQPVNRYGETFVYPLEPRDVEASAIIAECYVRNKGVTTPTGIRGVWLDTPMIDLINGEGTIRNNFPGMVRMFNRFGIDMTKNPVLVFPTLHYQNGGIEMDPWGRTNVKGLMAAGEVGGGVHGKNRLIGNSTLDCLVFGRRTGMAAADYVKKGAKAGKPALKHVASYTRLLKEAGVKPERKAPILLPDYRGRAALARSIDIF